MENMLYICRTNSSIYSSDSPLSTSCTNSYSSIQHYSPEQHYMAEFGISQACLAFLVQLLPAVFTGLLRIADEPTTVTTTKETTQYNHLWKSEGS